MITIAPNYTQRNYFWTGWKIVKAAKNFVFQFDEGTDAYTIWGYDDPEVYIVTIWKGDVPPAVVDAGYSQVQNDADKADFETNFKALGNKPINPKNILGHPITEQTIRAGEAGSSPASVVSHDLGDRTSWYQRSVKVTDETLSGNLIRTVFSSVNPWWINMDSSTSKLTYSYKFVPKPDGTFGKHSDWGVTVKVDNVAVTTGFTIDYINGRVTFALPLLFGQVVKATYWHNNGVSRPSEWLLTPAAGKKMTIDHVELQISKGVIITNTIRFEVWAGGSVSGYDAAGFSEAAFDAGYGQRRSDYRNLRDIINASNEGKGSIPSTAEFSDEIMVFPFNYVQAFVFDSKNGVTFRLWNKSDLELTGAEIATATFYIVTTNS